LHATCLLDKARCKNSHATTKAVRYYLRTQQYSVVALTDSIANVVERYANTAYGTPTILSGSGSVLTSSAEGNRYLYTGREWDETLKLYHYRARMYDAISGRFLGRDPIGYRNTFSLYKYTRNQPLSLVDPSGLIDLSTRPAGRNECGCQSCVENLNELAKAGDLVPGGGGFWFLQIPKDNGNGFCKIQFNCDFVPSLANAETRTNLQTGDINVVFNTFSMGCKSRSSFSLTWNHEMQHVKDSCNGVGTGLPECQRCLTKEFRAYLTECRMLHVGNPEKQDECAWEKASGQCRGEVKNCNPDQELPRPNLDPAAQPGVDPIDPSIL
ncbi:MAG: RHS repeat-associated core domain-containing protein, partial [Rubripirellula sp.]